jgi:hypothetical protein
MRSSQEITVLLPYEQEILLIKVLERIISGLNIRGDIMELQRGFRISKI